MPPQSSALPTKSIVTILAANVRHVALAHQITFQVVPILSGAVHATRLAPRQCFVKGLGLLVSVEGVLHPGPAGILEMNFVNAVFASHLHGT